MSRILFLPFAVESTDSEPSADLVVVSRQVPRLVADLVQRESSATCSYFPIVGSEGGQRGFLVFASQVPIDRILHMLGNRPRPEFVVDGRIAPDRVALRVCRFSEGDQVSVGELVGEAETCFDPSDLRSLLRHCHAEAWRLCGLRGEAKFPDEMPARALASLLEGMDEELSIAASLTRRAARTPFAPWLAALAEAPAHPLILRGILSCARLCIDDGRADAREAARALAEAATTGVVDLGFLDEALRLARASGDEVSFLTVREAVLALDPRRTALALGCAAARLEQGEAREALAAMRGVLRGNPDLPEAWYLAGLARSALGHRRRALRALRRAVTLLPDFHEARNRLGILLVSAGRYAEGHAELSVVLGERGADLSPLLHIAQACYYLRKFEEGAEHLRRAEELHPGDPGVAEVRRTFFPLDGARRSAGAGRPGSA